MMWIIGQSPLAARGSDDDPVVASWQPETHLVGNGFLQVFTWGT